VLRYNQAFNVARPDAVNVASVALVAIGNIRKGINDLRLSLSVKEQTRRRCDASRSQHLAAWHLHAVHGGMPKEGVPSMRRS